jgi:predicted regulator of amino acid metabolism with ACT domain
MINFATRPFSDAHINIDNLMSAGRGDVGYMILDTEKEVPASVIEELKKVDGFLKIRVIR